MVTGMANLRRGGGTRLQPSTAMCYVAEVTSGKVAAYAIPWSPTMYAAGQMQSGALVLVAATPLPPSTAVGRGHSGTGTRRRRAHRSGEQRTQ